MNHLSLTDIEKTIITNRLPDPTANIMDYYYNNINILKDINKLADIDLAADLLHEHLVKEDYIALVTDYDSDGINSASILTNVFRFIFKYDNYKVFVNKRKNGNGMNPVLVGRIENEDNRKKIGLCILADHGSSDNTAFGHLRGLDIDVLLTDHHEIPPDNYPVNANVVINNQRQDSTYSKNVSGSVIALLTMMYYYNKYHDSDLSVFNIVMPYAAISTITDVMSLDEPVNRHIVKTGLNEMNSFRDRRWLILRQILEIPGLYRTKDLGFKLGPLINSGNRTGNEELVYDMLTNEDLVTVKQLAYEVSKNNTYRKEVTKNIMRVVKDEVIKSTTKSFVCVVKTVLAINGIVASNVNNIKNAPVVCFINGEEGRLEGSCRANVVGFNMLGAIRRVHELNDSILIKFGGHKEACGCSINEENYELFKMLFEQATLEQLDNMPATVTSQYELAIPISEVTPNLACEIEKCSPYGKNWREPIIKSRIKVGRVFKFGDFAKIMFKVNGGDMEAMFMSGNGSVTPANIQEKIKQGDTVDILYTLSMESYRNSYKVSLFLIDILK